MSRAACVSGKAQAGAHVPQVIAVWEELEARDYGYKGLPKYALGVSSGGAMALVLAQFFPLQVLCAFLLLCGPREQLVADVEGIMSLSACQPMHIPQLWTCQQPASDGSVMGTSA